MKSTELRVGNWIYQGKKYRIGKAKPYGIYQLSLLEKGNLHVADYYKEFEPIPITEEWLLNFGFEDTNNSSFIIGLPDGFLEVESDLSYGIVMGNTDSKPYELGYWYSGELKYVHQLQNLYFALCGKELTTK